MKTYRYNCPFTEVSRGIYQINSKTKLTKEEIIERFDVLDCDIITNKSDAEVDSSDYTEEVIV